MPSRNLLRTISWILLAVFPGIALAADSGMAVVYPDGSISVNGTELVRSQALVEGDRLATSGSGATIAEAGATLQMAANSGLVYHADGARVLSGAVSITTSRGLAAHALNVTIEPSSPAARYAVSQESGKLIIAAMEGSLRVSDGKQTMVVEQDKALVAQIEPMALAEGGVLAGDQDNGKKKGGAVAAAGIGITLSKATLITIAALGAIAGIIIVLLLTNRRPASGSH